MGWNLAVLDYDIHMSLSDDLLFSVEAISGEVNYRELAWVQIANGWSLERLLLKLTFKDPKSH